MVRIHSPRPIPSITTGGTMRATDSFFKHWTPRLALYVNAKRKSRSSSNILAALNSIASSATSFVRRNRSIVAPACF